MNRMVPSPSLTERVADLVREDLLSGNYAIGDSLRSESEMARSFGVSRTVMREAVARLKSQGLLESRQGSGLFVKATAPQVSFQIDVLSEIELGRALQVLELREGFEVAAAGFAAGRATPADIGRMRDAHSQMEKASAVQDLRGGTFADLEFHMAICEAAHNPLYPQLFKTFQAFLTEMLDVARGNSLNRLHDSRPSQNEHHAIVLAIEKKDVAAAKKAAEVHLQNTRTRLEKAMSAKAN